MVSLNDGVSWATIVGGFTGFLSLGWLVAEHLTKRPKLLLATRDAIYHINESSCAIFSLHLEFGNVGQEPTTITKVQLETFDGEILEPKVVRSLKTSSGKTFAITLLETDHRTRLCEKGMAFVEKFDFHRKKTNSLTDLVQGTLTLTLLGGKTKSLPVVFTKT